MAIFLASVVFPTWRGPSSTTAGARSKAARIWDSRDVLGILTL
jgi:hypothetical protein